MQLQDSAWTRDPVVGGSVLTGSAGSTTGKDPGHGGDGLFSDGATSGQLTPTIGSRSAPGACSGTTGATGRTASIRRYGEPRAGRASASPLLGHSAIARSAWAVIVSDGLTPRFAEIAEPSTTCRPGWPYIRW